MGFIPSLPAQSRNGRPALRPVFVRPSGGPSGGPVTATGFVGFSIANMPPYGRVFVDDVELDLRGGRWDGGAFIVPLASPGSRIRVTNQSGSQVRGEEGLVDTASVFDWNTLPIIAGGTGPNTLRIQNMTGGGRVFIDDVEVSPVGGRWDSSTWVLLNPPRGRRLRIVAVNGVVREQDFGSVVDIENANWATMGVRAAASPTGLLAIEGLPAGWSVWVPIYRASDGADASAQVNGYLRLGQSTGGSDPTVVTAKAGPFTAPELKFRSPDGTRWVDYPNAFTVPVNNGVVVNASALFAPRGSSDVGGYSGIGGGGGSMFPILPLGGTLPIAATAPLTVVGQPGWAFFLGNVGASTPLASAAIPAAGSLTNPVAVGQYDLGVNNGTRFERRTITVPPGGATIDLRAFFAPPPDVGGTPPVPPPGTSAVRTGIVVVGMPRGGYAYLDGRYIAGEWLDTEQTRWFLPSPPTASVSLQVKTRDESVIRQGPIGVPADRQQEVLYDHLPLLPVAGAPPAGTPRNTQGNTTASPTLGTILLSGAPPQSTVRVAGLADYVVNDSLLPVALDVAPGTVGVTVIPPGGVQRSTSVPVTVGATTELAYGSMTTPSNVEVAVGQCGLIPAPPPGVPESVCEGVVYPATDGTRWLGVMREGKVGLVRQVDVPTPTVVAEGRPWGLYALAAVAIGGGAWWWLNRDEKESKTENPGKRKCACGGH